MLNKRCSQTSILKKKIRSIRSIDFIAYPAMPIAVSARYSRFMCMCWEGVRTTQLILHGMGMVQHCEHSRRTHPFQPLFQEYVTLEGTCRTNSVKMLENNIIIETI